jgi:hypothetical protein
MPNAQGEGSEFLGRFHRFVLRTGWGGIVVAVSGLGVLGLAIAQPAAPQRREITLTAQSVPLSTAQPTLDQAGDLRFMGGLWLQSQDQGFGGLSGLAVSNTALGTRILAVTDQGEKYTATAILKDGRLHVLEGSILEPLLGPNRAPVTGKVLGDAEALTRLPDGRILVSFERRHRIWAYGPDLTGPATPFATPAALDQSPSNKGLESLVSWPDGRILAITERLERSGGTMAAFLWSGGAWSELEWKPSASGFEPADATVAPDGDLLVLERAFSALPPVRLSSRILRVKAETVRAGARLTGELVAELTAPLISENFEGIAARLNAEGRTEIVLVSDNNFNSIQRTLLLWFELRARAQARGEIRSAETP